MLIGTLLGLLVTAIGAGMLYGAASAAEERALSGAEAVAHGVVISAYMMPARDDLSIQVQAGRDCLVGASRPEGYQAADEALCSPLADAARDLAERNGVTLISLVVGPNIRDQAGPPRPGRLDVLAVVEARGPLSALPICAGDRRDSGWCHPHAAMGAELVS